MILNLKNSVTFDCKKKYIFFNISFLPLGMKLNLIRATNCNKPSNRLHSITIEEGLDRMMTWDSSFPSPPAE